MCVCRVFIWNERDIVFFLVVVVCVMSVVLVLYMLTHDCCYVYSMVPHIYCWCVVDLQCVLEIVWYVASLEYVCVYSIAGVCLCCCMWYLIGTHNVCVRCMLVLCMCVVVGWEWVMCVMLMCERLCASILHLCWHVCGYYVLVVVCSYVICVVSMLGECVCARVEYGVPCMFVVCVFVCKIVNSHLLMLVLPPHSLSLSLFIKLSSTEPN